MIENEIIAVIEIGSSAIRLLIAQSGGSSDWDLLESAEQPLALGREVFRKGSIERRAMNRAIEILKGYQELMAPYSIERIVAVGTSALEESENREMFIDSIMLQTGIEIKIIDNVEATQLNWLAVRKPLLKALPGFKRHNAMIFEAGAGSTDLMILKKGKISKSHSIPIGTLRYYQKLDQKIGGNINKVRESFSNHVSRTLKGLSHELNLSTISKLIAVGNDARLAAMHLGYRITNEMSVIPGNEFREFITEIELLSPEEMITRLGIPLNEAELFYPAMVVFIELLNLTKADEILIPATNLRQGLLINYAAGRKALREIFSTQVLTGSESLARHYHSDMKHAEFVRKQAVLLYESLNAKLGLMGSYRLFLEAAALLHDIGSYIGAVSHHKHSQYIINNSDIIGLSAADKEIVGHIVRYHRRAKPRQSHSQYMNLNRTDRIVIQKLSALLRVADALDQSHSQKVLISNLKIEDDRLIIQTSYPGDLSMEEISLAEKGDLFENIFGLKTFLRFDESLRQQ